MANDRSHLNELMDRASAGDGREFGDLAQAVQDALFRFALAHGLRWADAMEAVQETLLRAFSARAKWRTGADAMAWLYGIAMNVVRERRRRTDGGDSLGLDLESIIGRPDSPAGEAADHQQQRLRRLAEAIAALPPRQQEAIVCRFLRQMSVDQTAATMGCAEGTVKAAVFSALENLKAAMKGYE